MGSRPTTTTTMATLPSSAAATSCAAEFIDDHVAMATRLIPAMPKVNLNKYNNCHATTLPETADGVLYGIQMVANELAFACTPLHGYNHGGSNSHFDNTSEWSRASSAGTAAADVYPGVSLRRSKMKMDMGMDDYSFTNSKTRSLLRGQRATQFMNESESKYKKKESSRGNNFMWELKKKLNRNLNLADRGSGRGGGGRGGALGSRRKPRDEGYYEDLLLHGDGASSKGSSRSPPPSLFRLSKPDKCHPEKQDQPNYQHPGAVGTYIVARQHHNMMDDNTTLTSLSGSHMEHNNNMQPPSAARTSPGGYTDQASEASGTSTNNSLVRNTQDVFRPKTRHNMAELRARFGDLKMMTSSNRLSSKSEQWMQETAGGQQQQQRQLESRQDHTGSYRRRGQDDRVHGGRRSTSPPSRQRPSTTTGVGTKKKRSNISSSHSSSLSPSPPQTSSSRSSGGGRANGGGRSSTGYRHQRRRSKQHRRGDDWAEEDSDDDDEDMKAPISWTPPSPPGMTLEEKQRQQPIVVEDENDDDNGRPAAVANKSDPKSYPNPFRVIKKADKPSRALNAEELYQTAYHSKKNRDIDELKQRLSKPNRVPPTVPDYLQETLKVKLERANDSLKSLQKAEEERQKGHHHQRQRQQPPRSSLNPKQWP